MLVLNLHDQNVICAVNTQHNCARNQCSTTLTKKVHQEREKTQTLEPELNHLNPKDLLLNSAQMWSSHYVQNFHKSPLPLDCEMAIHKGAAREVEIGRAKDAKKGKRGNGKGKESSKAPKNVGSQKNTWANTTQGETSGAPVSGNSHLSLESTSMNHRRVFTHNAPAYTQFQSPSGGENSHNGYQFTFLLRSPNHAQSFEGLQTPQHTPSILYHSNINASAPSNLIPMAVAPAGSTLLSAVQRPSALAPILQRLSLQRHKQ